MGGEGGGGRKSMLERSNISVRPPADHVNDKGPPIFTQHLREPPPPPPHISSYTQKTCMYVCSTK